jgi:hypothetical protein
LQDNIPTKNDITIINRLKKYSLVARIADIAGKTTKRNYVSAA